MTLRPAEVGDIGFIRSLTMRPDYAPFIGDSDEATLRRWIEGATEQVLIWEGAGARGFAVFRELDDPSACYELFRIALDQAGGGRGDEFFGLLLDHGFATLGARRIWLDASGENPRALRIYTRAGCTVEGIMRQQWWRPCLGRAVDLHMLGILREEWQVLRP
ncbi:MAG: GNAT family protein [Paracoccaceae bacterium]